jgi:type IV conjugative transfer system coupling protein TraD
MGAQVFKTAIIFSLLVVALAWMYQAYNYYEVEKLHLLMPRFQSEFFVESRGTPDTQIRYKHPEYGWIAQTAAEIYRNQEIKEIYEQYNEKAAEFFYISMIPGGIAGLAAFIFFWFSGRDMEGDYHVRGTYLVTAKELKKWSKAKWKEHERRFGKDLKHAPRYTISGIQFPPNAVEAQTVISGTVGTGKTNALRELVSTIRDLNGKAIIYDRMGTFVENYYNPETDVIINPFDKRSHSWSPFYEAEDDIYFSQLAEVFIPDRPNVSDQFWTQSARIVFEQAAKKIFNSGNFSNKRLNEAILQYSATELADLVSHTSAKHFFNKDIAKTAGSIRANLITELRFLEFLRDDGEAFSIRQWIKDDNKKGFVFLTGDAEHAAATRNIISSVIETAANALMTCDQVNDPKVWFIMDEVPTLNRLPFLPTSLAEIRQFGGAFVLGYQVYSQLESLYGEKEAQTITGNLNNRIVFNTPDADTADVFSKSLGSEDVEERRESMTVGANETRDGVGFMSQRTERRIVTPSQIQNLPQFEAYIAFAYDSPTAFVRFKPYPVEKVAQKFVRYAGNGFSENDMELLGARSDAGDDRDPIDAATESFKEKPSFEEEFRRYRESLIQDGLEFFVNDENEERLKEHFAKRRAKKIPINEIGPPPLSGYVADNEDTSGMKRNVTWKIDAKEGSNDSTLQSLSDDGSDKTADIEEGTRTLNVSSTENTNDTAEKPSKARKLKKLADLQVGGAKL